jgi:hypothetical protein
LTTKVNACIIIPYSETRPNRNKNDRPICTLTEEARRGSSSDSKASNLYGSI